MQSLVFSGIVTIRHGYEYHKIFPSRKERQLSVETNCNKIFYHNIFSLSFDSHAYIIHYQQHRANFIYLVLVYLVRSWKHETDKSSSRVFVQRQLTKLHDTRPPFFRWKVTIISQRRSSARKARYLRIWEKIDAAYWHSIKSINSW